MSGTRAPHKRRRRARLGLRHPTPTTPADTPPRWWDDPTTNQTAILAYIRNTYGEDTTTRILEHMATEATGTPPTAVTYTPPEYDAHYIPIDYYDHRYTPLNYYDGSGHTHPTSEPPDPGKGPLPRDPITGQLRTPTTQKGPP